MSDEKIGRDEKKKTFDQPSNYKGGETVRVVFKENRTHEVRLGGTWYIFGPYEEKEIPRSCLAAQDWPHEAKYFTVKE